MRLFRCGLVVALGLGLAAWTGAVRGEEIVGDVDWPDEWIVFAPAGHMAPPLPAASLRLIPEVLERGDDLIEARRVRATESQFDFGPLFGTLVEGQTAHVFIPVEAAEAGEATFGFGADWWMQAWVNGELVLDTTDTGNDHWPPSLRNHLVTASMNAGTNIVAIRFVSGSGSSILAAGGPRELRADEPPSILRREALAEFERLAERLGENGLGDPAPTQGWAPEFRREVAEPDRERVAVQVDWADNRVDEAPVTFGMPFPRGALPDASRARLVDAAGRAVPAEILGKATWDGPDGPVRWAWVHARLSRDGMYAVEYGREVVPPEFEGLTATEDARAITVTTGPMRFVISRTQPTLVESAAIDPDGVFGPDSRIVHPEQAAEALPSVTDTEGVVYRASPEGLTVELVERGPMRAAVRREGWYVDPDGRRFCQFITYTYFHAGEPGFRHDHTLVVAFNTHEYQIRDIEVPLPLALEASGRRAWFAADESADGSLIEQPADDAPLSLIEHYLQGWRLYRGEERLQEGERSGGWFGLADGRWGAFAGIEHFWQNSPAELEVAGNRLNLHLYASRGTEPLDFRPSRILGDRGEEYPGDHVFHSRWYRDGLDEMTQGYGTAKTHSMHVQFFHEPERAAAAHRARRTNTPVIAYADPEWACRTEAFGRVRHHDPERFPDLEAILDAIVHRRHWLRERLQNYGWFHFGDVNGNLRNAGDPENVTFHHWRRWASMFYGNPNVMPLLFMRSGRRDAWDFHRVNTRHITDIDICHLDSEAFNKWRGGRYGGDGGIVHFAAELYGLGCDSHLRFMLYDYYLNANLRTWEVANQYMDAHAAHRTRPENLRYRHRHTGGPLRLFTEAWQATWNPEYLDIVRQFAQILYEAKEEFGVTRYCDVYMNEGKIFYYQATGDERMRDLFLSDMRILRQKRDAHVFADTRSTTLYGLSHAYWFTGDRRFLPFALWQLDVARKGTITDGDPGRIGAIDWALEYAYNATLGNQLPAIMAVLADVGEPLPRAEGPTATETSGALHFLKEDREAAEIAVQPRLYTNVARPFANWRSWAGRLPEGDRPALALVGPDGREMERIGLLGEPAAAPPGDHEALIAGGVPSDVVVFRIPAGSASGVYTVQPVTLAVPLRLRLFASTLERWMTDPRDAAVSGQPYVPYYFEVPAGTGPFLLRVKTAALRGTYRVEVLDEAGASRGLVETTGGSRTWQTVRLDAGSPDRVEAWQVQVFPRVDLFLAFDGVPGYLAGSPEAFFDPGRVWSAPRFSEPPEGEGPVYRAAEERAGAVAAGIPANARVRIPVGADRAAVHAREGTLEMWIRCHRGPDEILDRTLVEAGGLRVYRRANIGTYVTIGAQGYQTGFVLPPDRWTHLAVTWTPHADGGVQVALFADGVFVRSSYSRTLRVDGDWPDRSLAIPAGESALSIAGLRISDRARYEGDFTPPSVERLSPDADARVVWPTDLDGGAWLSDGE